MSGAQVHQIFYDAASKAALDPGFIALDNLANERPDWREYWPVRKFFQRHGKGLDEERLYGFVSPKFGQKTGLAAGDALGFAAAAPPGTDVVIFSPAWDMGALFWNVFDQTTFFYPEFTQVAQQFTRKVGLANKLDQVVTDSRNTVFCNYFLARPRFWRRWLEINGAMFEMSERKGDRIGGLLRKQLLYAPHAPRVELKVFLMERIATLLLATTPEFAAVSCRPFELPASDTVFNMFATEAVAADALKIAYATTRQDAYRTAFQQVQGRVLQQVRAGQPGPRPAG